MEYDYLLYTDGACIGNPGPGGWAAILQDRAGEERILRGSATQTTNNRMELRAAIEGLKATPEGARVLLRTDSRHLADALTKGWAARWRAHGWKRNRREAAENVDLWEELLQLVERRSVTVEWVRGHAGDPLNERCNAIARAEAEHATGTDAGYQQRQATEQLFASEDSSAQALQISCSRTANGSLTITDGRATVTIPLAELPELLRQIAALLVQK